MSKAFHETSGAADGALSSRSLDNARPHRCQVGVRQRDPSGPQRYPTNSMVDVKHWLSCSTV